MKDITFNYTYLRNRDYWFQEEGFKKEMSALLFLMNYTGVYRVFTKEDVFELMTRVALVIKEQPIFEHVFLKQKIFKFKIDALTHVFDINDLKELIGFEHIDGKTNFCPRETWISKRPQFWSNAISMCMINGTDILAHRVENENEISYSCPDHTYKDITTKEISDAEFLAGDVVKEIGEEPFVWLEKTHPLKLRELEMRRNAAELNFAFDELPLATQKELWAHWWPNEEHFKDEVQRKYIGDLVKLAFFWANGFITDSYGNKEEDFFKDAVVDERVNINIDDYIGADGGFNLIHTYYEHDLGALFPLLMEPEIQIQSGKPWEKLYL
jgi:hypothetical protein